jgi:allantoinase
VFEAQAIADGATQFKCCPPIREADNREELWHALGRGDIDCIVSDHSPCTPELKRLDLGEFGAAWGGISSLQVGLPAVWTEARLRGYTLVDVVRWMSERPARLARMQHKGMIERGYHADFAVFAPDDAFVVDPGRLHHRNPVTPYAHRPLAGVVRSTWLHGREVTGDEPLGHLISRGEA